MSAYSPDPMSYWPPVYARDTGEMMDATRTAGFGEEVKRRIDENDREEDIDE